MGFCHSRANTPIKLLRESLGALSDMTTNTQNFVLGEAVLIGGTIPNGPMVLTRRDPNHHKCPGYGGLPFVLLIQSKLQAEMSAYDYSQRSLILQMALTRFS
jgi:hypothetical protein